MTKTITVIECLTAGGFELAEFVAVIDVNTIPESGDGWNEPRVPKHFEFDDVRQISGPQIDPAKLRDWAAEWVACSQDEIERRL